jgi:UDP-2,4-diacetamido-2,4,6-trideoxy-beta-L-altropyranose hydrolase
MKVVLRADGDSQTGLGHIIRSAAIMLMIQDYFDCELWTRNPNFFPYNDFDQKPNVRKFIVDFSKEAECLASEVSPGTIVVLDGYRFDSTYQKILKDAGIKLVCIDDIVAYHFYADVVINHAGGLSSSEYSQESYTSVFVGPQYSLIRPFFYKKNRPARNVKDRRIFVNLGAADPNNDTDLVLSELVENRFFDRIDVVLGAANKNIAYLKEKYSNCSEIFFFENLTGFEICNLMYQCPYAVIAPSTVCYEYMSIGGFVFLYVTADNQQRIFDYFIKKHLAYDFSFLGSDLDWQKTLSGQEKIFDGKSPQRIRNIFLSLNESQL